MSWVKLDDSYADNPRVLRAGKAASGWYVGFLCYCARHLTDGHVPRVLVTQADPLCVDALYAEALIADCGEHPDCVTVPHYLDYQPAREQVTAGRAAARERMESVRSRRTPRSPDVRANTPRTGNDGSPEVPLPPAVTPARTRPSPLTTTPPVVEDVGYAREDDNGGGEVERQEGQEPQDPGGWSVVLAAVKELARRDRGAGGRAQQDVADPARFSLPARIVLARELANRLVMGWLAEELVDELCEGHWSEVGHPLRVWQTVAANLPVSRRPLADVDR